MSRHRDPGGTPSHVASDFVLRFGKCIGSSLDVNGSVQLTVTGVGDLDPINPSAAPTDELGERAEDQPAFGALGFMGRPLPPEDGAFTEVICQRTADGLIPLAVRDRRIHMGGAAPGEGVQALVGYGGGHYSLTPVPGNGSAYGGGTLHVLYCPYDFVNGVPQKAHAVIMDPSAGNECLQLIHGDGMAIVMSSAGDKPLIMKNAAGDATLRLDDHGITLTATQIVLSGGVILGDPLTAVPLLPGPASPGSTRVFVSP